MKCQGCAATSVKSAILVPFTIFAGFLLGLVCAVGKVVPGSIRKMRDFWPHYCVVIRAGQAAYDVETGGRSDTLGQALEHSVRSSGTKCAAELCCCCFPVCFILWALIPVFLLVELLWIATMRGVCGGLQAGCGPCKGYPKRFHNLIDNIDAVSSHAAYTSTAKGRLFSKAEPSSQQQPTTSNIPVAAATFVAPNGGGATYGSGSPSPPGWSTPSTIPVAVAQPVS